MKINYDAYNNPEPFRIYFGTMDYRKICVLNGIKPESIDLQLNFNNTSTLSFTVDRYVNYYGESIESNAYNLLDCFMRVYVENVGWFVMDAPTTNNDGISETKEVSAVSVDTTLVQRDLVGFKINCGTTDSYEMLVDGNVDVDDYTGVEIAKEQIKFYNKDNPDLSLLHIVLKAAEVDGWEIGYVDPIPKTHKSYEDGKPVEKTIKLEDEIGYFEIDSQSAYAFYTKDIEKYFECVILFDILNFKINAYRVENIGKDTNINIGFRNLQNSNSIVVSDKVYTRYTVSGQDNLGIEYVNFGSNRIKNIDYTLNTKYINDLDLIKKYKLWRNYVEEKRPDYIEATRNYNKQLDVVSELYDRVPLDDCSTDWDSFQLEDLQDKKSDYEAEKTGIESFFKDESGNIDSAALQASDLAPEYNQIVNVILPNIEAAIQNKTITTKDDKINPVEDFDWTHYGLDELAIKIKQYESTKFVLETGGYAVPYEESTGHSKDNHILRHQEYIDTCNQLDEGFSGSCAEAYAQRKQEVSDAEALRDEYNEARSNIVTLVNESTWSIVDDSGQSISFTKQDLDKLSQLYSDTDYVNENMFLVKSDDQNSAIDEQQKLFEAAVDELYAVSQPQYIYTTTLDNFLAMVQYKDFAKHLALGDFIRLDVRDDYQVKMRVIKISFNPLTFDNDLTLEFSNVIKSKSGTTDFMHLLDLNSGSSKNQITGSSNGSSMNEDSASFRYILNKLLSSSLFNNKITNVIDGKFGNLIGESVIVKDLEAEMIKATDITAKNGFFEYLQAALISADKIVADSGVFGELSSKLALIDNLLSGTVSAELGHIINLTAHNVTIDEAVIRDLIAAQITVSMLKAGNITLTDKMQILSENGFMVMNGETLQIKGVSDAGTEYVAIQLGYDSTNKPSLIIRDETGAVMLDAKGLHENIVPDGFIKTDMIGQGQVSKDKLSFNVVEGDENGNVDAAKVIVNGHGIDAEFTSITHTVTQLDQKIDSTATYNLYINMPNGNKMLPGGLPMNAVLFKNSVDVTDQWGDSFFTWTRQSADSYGDIYWNSQHETGTKSLVLTETDVHINANFQCKFETEQLVLFSQN